MSVVVLALSACEGERPGALEGTWKVTEPVPVTVTFRDGEMETMGVATKVSYRPDGNAVLVTRMEGARKGSAVRYVIVDADTIRSGTGTFHRVR